MNGAVSCLIAVNVFVVLILITYLIMGSDRQEPLPLTPAYGLVELEAVAVPVFAGDKPASTIELLEFLEECRDQNITSEKRFEELRKCLAVVVTD